LTGGIFHGQKIDVAGGGCIHRPFPISATDWSLFITSSKSLMHSLWD